ncbi:MAG TPA: hypothetical protein VGM12_25270, partial [Trebonia sp.]
MGSLPVPGQGRRQHMANQNPGGDAGQHDGQRPGRATGPLAGESRRRPPPESGPRLRRAATWLTWWVILMSLWVAVDDSFE